MSKSVNIGAWHITPDLNKLTLGSKDFFVEPQVMEVLIYFAQNPDKVISVNELVENVWKGRVVGDHSVYQTITQIRKVLGEDTGRSYITTIRKRGYQLTQLVEWVEATAQENRNDPSVTSTPEIKDKRRLNKAVLAAVLLPILAVAIWFGSNYVSRTLAYRSVESFDIVKPFSVLIGEEKHPSYSPDGQFISYSHMPKSGGNFKLFVQSLDGESPRQVTKQAGNDFSSSWSPDGSELVFVRHSNGECHLMKMPVIKSGPVAIEDPVPEKILSCNDSGLPNEVVWGRDGYIYFTDSESAAEPSKIYRYSLKTSKKEQITNPASGKSKGDIHFILSNDSKFMAFARDLNWNTTQIKLLDLKTGDTTDLFKLSGWKKALAWSYDDQYVYYIDKADNIQAYSIKHGFHKKVLDSPSMLHSISGHRSEDKLAIMTGGTGIDIWGKKVGLEHPATPVIESSEVDLFPEFAHKTSAVAFTSLRGGRPQIWVKMDDGREYQASNFSDGRMIQRMRWSPDDRFLLATNERELYTINVETKEHKTLWQSEASYRIEAASWSPNGDAVYFSSDLDGDWQIYKMDLRSNSAPVKVTDRGGYSPELTEDGHMLYYKYHQSGIWKMRLDTQDETKIIEDTNVFAYNTLYARGEGFFYLSISDKGNTLNFYNLINSRLSTIEPVLNPLLDYAISTDGSSILFPKVLNQETEIKVLGKNGG